jgi:hypothetical protein
MPNSAQWVTSGELVLAVLCSSIISKPSTIFSAVVFSASR